MRAVRVLPDRGLVVDDADEPRLADDSVLVRVAFGGICGSDLHYARYERNGAFIVTEPLTLGHELAGTIEAIGPAVERALAVGEAVTVHPAFPCALQGVAASTGMHVGPGTFLGSASTTPHTQGGFAELVAVSPDQIRTLPAGIPVQRAALAEPMGVAAHAVALAGDLRGRRVFVSGCGPIGLLTIMAAAQHRPAELVVSDLSERALAVAKEFGATETFLVPHDRIRDHSSDVVIEASGAPVAISDAFRAVATAGLVVQLAIPALESVSIPTHDLLAREVTVRGSWRFDTEIDDAVRMLAAHPEVDRVVTHVFGIEEAEKAFAVAADPAESSKVLLRIQ